MTCKTVNELSLKVFLGNALKNMNLIIQTQKICLTFFKDHHSFDVISRILKQL